jgi:hypothetical protein
MKSGNVGIVWLIITVHLFTLLSVCPSNSSHPRSNRLHSLLLLVLWTLLPVTFSCSQKMRLKLNGKRFNEVLETRNEMHMFWQGRVGALSHFQHWNLPMSALTGDTGTCSPAFSIPVVIISFSCILETTANWYYCSIILLFALC